MTDTPRPDHEAVTDEGEEAVVEPALVEEGDEIDLDDDQDDDQDDESEAEPAYALATDDELDDEPDEPEPDETPVRDEKPVREEAAPFPFATSARDDDEPPIDGDKPKRHWGRWVVLGLVGVAAAAYLVGYLLTGTRMPADTTVGGIDVGGMSPSAARTAIEEATTPNLDRRLSLTHGEGDEIQEFTIRPADAGLALDLDRSVDRAGGQRSWDPRDMVGLFFGEHEHDLALDVDDSKLQSFIGSIGESVNIDVVEAQITFPKGEPKAREPEPGLVVSRSDTADAIRAAYLVDAEPVDVPTVAVEPAVDSTALAEAMTSIAEPAVSGPVVIKVGDKRVSLPVTAYAPALVVRVEEGTLVPHLDAKKLAGPLTDSTTGIGTKAVDATVKIEDGKPVIVPGKEGIGLQPQEMATKLVPALTKTGDERAVEIEAKVVEPEFTTEDAKALRITEKISEFETQFPYAEYRNVNQGRAAEIINGTILEPGETFSFNDVVGERTEANGFVSGTVINGGVFREELGGGVSQVVTTLYNAGFFGGMDDVEHHPHAFYIDRYPAGREATVYFGSLDLRFKNPTKYGVLVRAYVVPSTPTSAGEMHVELWSTKVWDKIEAGQSPRRNGRTPGEQYDDTDRCVPQGPIEGFDIDIYRTFYRDGKKVKTETDTANYQAADRVVCGKKPD